MKEKMKKYILTNVDIHNELELVNNAGEQFFVKNYGGFDGWHLYQGCDLIIGDVTLDHLVGVLLRYA